jgi:hypothetical protein
MSQDGLYALQPNEYSIDKSNRVSGGRLDKSFREIDYETHQAQLIWNVDRHGVDIYITPLVEGSATHYFFDQRTGGFFPIQHPDAHGPTAAMLYDADSPNDRAVLLGGFDSKIRYLTRAAETDDTQAIASNVMLGPILSPWPDREFIIGKLQAVMSDASTSALQYEVRVGDAAQAAESASAAFSGSWNGGRNPTVWNRARGAAAIVRLAASSGRWSLEKIEALLTEAGAVRVRT